MIPRECKRLAEVDFPIAEVSRHAVQEPSRSGHPSALHKWWARRPLASSRAVLLALLLPDPCDSRCPAEFLSEASKLFRVTEGVPRSWAETADSAEALRRTLLRFVVAFANWGNAANPLYVRLARGLVRAAHGQEPPLVVDPFAGGGSIPLEALRLGCDAFGSDLNPVACLILRAVLEDIPRSPESAAKQLRNAGSDLLSHARRQLSTIYPTSLNGTTPLAYIWARTVVCEAPDCGAEIPLIRTFWLSKKRGRKKALQPCIDRRAQRPAVHFRLYEPRDTRAALRGTVANAKATCLCCGSVLPPRRVREQLKAQRGGADPVFDESGQRTGGAKLLVTVGVDPTSKTRQYNLPTQADYEPVREAQIRLEGILDHWKTTGGDCPVPNEPLPLMSGTFNVPFYGMNQWGDLFTARQKLSAAVLAAAIRDGNDVEASQVLLSLSLGKHYRHCNAISKWHRGSETVAGAFALQALPMAWDFPEMQPFAPYAGGLKKCIEDVAKVLDRWPKGSAAFAPGQVVNSDARSHPLPDEAADVWFTDPPYYFAVPYADLSDFFFVGLKRALPGRVLGRYSQHLESSLTPKEAELCEMAHWDSERYGHKDKTFFEDGMTEAFSEGRRVLKQDGIGSVVFAHTTTEGWEALLSGMIRGGWNITGSWPIATERGARLRARESAALATSVHLVCRPRSEDAVVGDWAEVLGELSERVESWMGRLEEEGVRGADLVFACIGPALEIFSRHRAVETAEGEEIALAAYLERIWEVVSHTALHRILDATERSSKQDLAASLEEDSRLTALFLWVLQTTEAGGRNGGAAGDDGKRLSLPFDVVRRFAQPMGIDLDAWTGRIIRQKKGVVRLLPVAERARDLFGEDGAKSAADWIEIDPEGNLQRALFPEALTGSGIRVAKAKRKRGRARNILDIDQREAPGDATTLDRVHAAMLLQADGHANALRALISAEQERGPGFLRLANALSALYPPGSNEKRLLAAMLLAAPR